MTLIMLWKNKLANQHHQQTTKYNLIYPSASPKLSILLCNIRPNASNSCFVITFQFAMIIKEIIYSCVVICKLLDFLSLSGVWLGGMRSSGIVYRNQVGAPGGQILSKHLWTWRRPRQRLRPCTEPCTCFQVSGLHNYFKCVHYAKGSHKINA